MKKQLMTHIVAGYPDMDTSEKLVEAMDRVGVSFVEVQIPFSDPVADGETLMHAQKVALENNTTTEDCFALIERLQAKVSVPLLIMTYYNIVHAYGTEAFCARAAQLGLYGLIVPDIPLDEEPHEGFLAAAKKHGLHVVQVVSPLTPERRLKQIGDVASGMVYCVSREGITGSQETLSSSLGEYLGRVKQYIDVPLALGFGISHKEHVEVALQHADIAVMGSAVVNVLDGTKDGKDTGVVEEFLNTILQ